MYQGQMMRETCSILVVSSSSSSSSVHIDQMYSGRRPLCPIHCTEQIHDKVKSKTISKIY